MNQRSFESRKLIIISNDSLLFKTLTDNFESQFSPIQIKIFNDHQTSFFQAYFDNSTYYIQNIMYNDLFQLSFIDKIDVLIINTTVTQCEIETFKINLLINLTNNPINNYEITYTKTFKLSYLLDELVKNAIEPICKVL